MLVSLTAALAAQPRVADAAGFALIEQSASGVGNAFAGAAASAEDAGTIFFNPAGMTRLAGKQVLAGVSAVGPSINFTNQGSTLAPPQPATPLTGGNGGDAGNWSDVPNLYLSWQADDRLWVGLGVNAPFGLHTDYAAGWVGRYQALDSELTTVNINPSIAYRVNDKVSLGVGLSAQKADVTLSKAIDVGTICFNTPGLGQATCTGLGLTPQSVDGAQQLRANGWGYGYNLGALFEIAPDMRVGVSYRSRIQYTLSGTSAFANVPAPLNASPQLQTSAATLALTVPDSASVSVFQIYDEKWDMMADMTWTHWSVFNQLAVQYANGAPASVTNEGWRDTWRFSLGLDYKLDAKWKIRSGLAWDQTPVPSPQLRTARIPDNARTWLAVGASWSFTKGAALDVSYAHLFVANASIDHSEPASGVLIGTYSSSANIASLQLSYRF
ncbi:MAG TPA: outer membrane protein transport protein [Burkholderiales bacterium]|nr:outer membrane protein transport protein [Burkholderiales bacterium]